MIDKKYEIVMSLITIFTIIVTAIGVSLAYFTTTLEGAPANVDVTTSTIGNVTFNGGVDFTASEIEPDWSTEKNFSITVAPSNVDQTVLIKIKYTNSMKDLNYQVVNVASGSYDANGGAKETSKPTDFLYDEVVKSTNSDGEVVEQSLPEHEVILVEKTFAASNISRTYNYKLTIAFPDTGENQNVSQGKMFDALLFAEFANDGGNTLYYDSEHLTGEPLV